MSTATDSRRSRPRDAVRLVLVDRDALARRAMREELTAGGEFVVAAEAAEEDDAIASVRRERPDLVLIDIGYPRLEGIRDRQGAAPPAAGDADGVLLDHRR